MNRDEKRNRIAGLPPERFVDGVRTVVHPREPTGGTWISLNDVGVGLALINWYAIQRRAPRPAVSRGDVIPALRSSESPEEAAARLEQLPLARINPFRLLGFFPEPSAVCEWRWDLESLSVRSHEWSATQWCSSGFDEPTAQQVRGAAFESVRTEPDAGTVTWLRRLHGSHVPGIGPFSVCMHRADAETVSYTELDVGDQLAIIRYAERSLCCLGEELRAESLRRIRCTSARKDRFEL